jgi:F0F1-type ATP synthase membrane subunit c/vacuolar-type H+-ATPase subunit K
MTGNKQEKIVPRILWGALLSSHIILSYVTINFMAKENSELNESMLYVLAGLAVGSGIMNQFFKIKSYSAKSIQHFIVPFIISLAMAESIHIYGMVGVAGEMIELSQYYYFLITGVVLHIICFPQLSKIRNKSF